MFLYILYTDDYRSNDPVTTFLKFSDDAAILALLNDDSSFISYEKSVSQFAQWCSSNFLELNVSKTKQMTVDFRVKPRAGSNSGQIVINGKPVEEVESFTYLGVTIDKQLTFSEHVTAVQKKCQQRLHVLRSLRSFRVNAGLLLLLYRSGESFQMLLRKEYFAYW